MNAEGNAMTLKLSHVGVAVRSLADAIRLYSDLLGTPPDRTDTVADEGVRIAFFPVGEVSVELTEPTGPDSPIARFLDRRGEGVHHLSFRVDNIQKEIERLQKAGYRMIDTKPRRGAGGSMIAFIHPKSTGGVLIELCEEKTHKSPGGIAKQ